MLAANCYIVYDEDTMEACVIDPGAEAKRVMREVNEHGLKVTHILLTHGHFDHIGGAEELRAITGAPISVHKHDQEMLMDPDKNESCNGNRTIVKFEADHLLDGSSVITVGELEFSVMPTPGHTKGCVCFKVGDVLFTGDTLFFMGIGRTDLYGGSEEQIIKSLKKIGKLSDTTLILPGHGQAGELGTIRRNNRYLQ